MNRYQPYERQTMSLYTKRPVTVEAEHITGTDANADAVVAWINNNGGKAVRQRKTNQTGIDIKTLEGHIFYTAGWTVIKGVRGEFYACKTDIFHDTYNPVSDGQVAFDGRGA